MLGKKIAYLALWSIGFIAARTLVASPMASIEEAIAGTPKNGGV
jgi:hypothetical protein